MYAIQSTGQFTGMVTVFDRRFDTQEDANKVLKRIKSANTGNTLEVIEVSE